MTGCVGRLRLVGRALGWRWALSGGSGGGATVHADDLAAEHKAEAKAAARSGSSAMSGAIALTVGPLVTEKV